MENSSLHIPLNDSSPSGQSSSHSHTIDSTSKSDKVILFPPESDLQKQLFEWSPEKVQELSERTRRIIKTEKRTDYESNLLYEHIKNFTYFETFNERHTNKFFEKNAFLQLCQRLKFQKMKGGRAVFREGDPSNGKMYILLSGEVSSVVKKTPKGSIFGKSPLHVSKLESQTSKGFRHAVRLNELEIEEIMSTHRSRIDVPSPVHPSGGESKFHKEHQRRKSIFDPNKNGGDSGTGTHNSLRSEEDIAPVPLKPDPKGIVHERRLSRFTTENSPYVNNASPPGGESSNEKRRGSFRMAPDTNLLKQAFKASRYHNDHTPQISDASSPRASLKSKFKLAGNLALNTIRMGKFSAFGKANGPISPTSAMSGRSNINPFRNSDQQEGNTTEEDRDSDIDVEELVSRHGILDKKIEKGGFFGEREFTNKLTRDCTILTNTYCEFLVITKRDFQYISENFDSKRAQTIKFITDFIPDLENIGTYEQMDRIIQTLQERTFERGSLITTEGEYGNQFFILCEGSCEIVKNIKIDETSAAKDSLSILKKMVRVGHKHADQISICKLQKGVYLGEEILYSKSHCYNFSIRVDSATAKVFAISRDSFTIRYPPTTQYEVQKLFQVKRNKYITLLKDRIESKYPDLQIVQDPEIPEKAKEFALATHPLVLGTKVERVKDPEQVEKEFVKQAQKENRPQSTLRNNRLLMALGQEEPQRSQSVDVTCQKRWYKTIDVSQIKHDINPYARSFVVPPQASASHVHKGRNLKSRGGSQNHNHINESLEASREVPKGILKDIRVHRGGSLPFNSTAYVSSSPKDFDKMMFDIERDRARKMDLRGAVELKENFYHSAMMTKKNSNEKVKKESVSFDTGPGTKPILDLHIDELLEGDPRAQKTHRIKMQLALGRSPATDLNNSVRASPDGKNFGITTLFKKAKKKLKRKFKMDPNMTFSITLRNHAWDTLMKTKIQEKEPEPTIVKEQFTEASQEVTKRSTFRPFSQQERLRSADPFNQTRTKVVIHEEPAPTVVVREPLRRPYTTGYPSRGREGERNYKYSSISNVSIDASKSELVRNESQNVDYTQKQAILHGVEQPKNAMTMLKKKHKQLLQLRGKGLGNNLATNVHNQKMIFIDLSKIPQELAQKFGY